MATESTENTERNDCCSVKCREHFIDMPETLRSVRDQAEAIQRMAVYQKLYSQGIHGRTRKEIIVSKETLIDSSFRPEHSGEPESSVFIYRRFWILACAGMTK
jgi:hypothetical protein